MKHCDLPECDGTGEFTTDVECLESTPGFFPVHSGRLPGVSQLKPPRVVIFGTDWGKQDRAVECRRKSQAGRPCRCQRFRRTARGEQPYPTEGYLFEVLTEARLDLEQVLLTNAVLGLAKRQEGNAPMFAGYPKYLRECGEYHRRCLRNVEKPALAVLMGQAHLNEYGCSLWSVVWPELFGPGGIWAATTTLADAFKSNRTVATTDGWRVQLTYHPSKKHLQPAWAWERTVEDLRQWSRTAGAESQAST